MEQYFHSVVLNEEQCMGCTNCMQRCPMEAIRVRNRKAIISKERCIDCGECIKVCPYHAHKSITDEIKLLEGYKYKVALAPLTIYSQFSEHVKMDKVFEAIKALGFDYVFDEAVFADISSIMIKHIMRKKNAAVGPLISSHCPAVIRLIQTRFPDLLDNLLNVESTVEIGARLIRRELKEALNCNDGEIGILYLSPCPARVTSIKQPLGVHFSALNGSISFKKIYGDILRNLKLADKTENYRKGNLEGIQWSYIGGQSEAIDVHRYVAVDGIFNVIEVLEAVEMGKLDSLEFIEASACIGGCVGGPLNIENPYIAKSKTKHLENFNHGQLSYNEHMVVKLLQSGFMLWDKEIVPKEIAQLDENFVEAMKKINQIDKIVKELPGLDCGSCGAPSCRAFAEDIVRGDAGIQECKFIRQEAAKDVWL